MADKKQLKNEVIKEVLACANNPIYFIETYCKVQHEKRGLVHFKLYEYQKRALKHFINNDKVIVNKARQLGFSTLTAAFIVWLIMFHYDKKVLIIATKAEVAKNMITKIKIMLNKLPRWMFLAEIEINRAHMVGLTNRSWVKSVATSPDAGRSEALSLLVFDEASHIENMQDLWRSAASTLATGGRVLAISTPNGQQNWFHEYFTKAQAGQNDWYAETAYWWENPEYAVGIKEDPLAPGGKTSPWFEKLTSGWSKLQIAQELLTSFTDSSNTYFDNEQIQVAESRAVDPIEKTGPDRNLWIWEEPHKDKKYLVSVDSSSGAGEDYSTVVVIDLWTMDVVAEYMGKIPADLLGDLCCQIGEKYNTAYICPENNSYGHTTCTQIKNNNYKNLCYFDKNGKLVDKWYAQWNNILPGFCTDAKSRPIVLAKLEEYFRKKLFTSRSKRFISELYTFSIINGKPQAQKGQHDDLILAYAIAIWVRDTVPDFGRPGQMATAANSPLLYVNRKDIGYQPVNAKHMMNEYAKQQQMQRIKEKIQKQTMVVSHPANSWYRK